MAAVFDLKKPLSGQIEKVKADLLEWQKHQVGRNLERRKCRDEWPMYLRVLDAVDLGVPFHEIGRTLFHLQDDDICEARANQLYKRACQMSVHFPV